MSRLVALSFAALIVVTDTVASTHREIPIRVEPPQTLAAIGLRGGDLVQSVEVRDGKAHVPADLPHPWTVSMTRFESSPYTKEDLDQGRVLVVRELGTLKGALRRTEARLDAQMTWLLKRADQYPMEIDISVPSDGAISIRIPAGQYHGAVLGATSGTRIRSGIVVRPGQTTDLGVLSCEPTVAVSMRVIDGRSRRPVANARVSWDPPEAALNARAAKDLYARRWSLITDARGLARFPSVGPLPVPVRWVVEADGFAPRRTSLVQLLRKESAALPDVQLHPEVIVVVRTTLPWLDGDFEGATLTIGEPEGPPTRRFRPVRNAPLKEGETTFRLHEFGRKRLSVHDAKGKTILYRDFEVTSQTMTIDLRPETIEIHGRVTRDEEVVERASVMLSDPDDGRVILAMTKTDEDGEYRFRTYQSDHLFVYAHANGSAVKKRFNAEARNDIRVDFELPSSGFALTVIDASTGSPIAGAGIDQRLTFDNETATQTWGETDAEGRFVVNAHPNGKGIIHIEAPGYASRELEISITREIREEVVKLDPTGPLFGRVVDIHGTPVVGASISAGYDSEFSPQPYFETITDPRGRFRFDSAPAPGTPFYVAAAGHALGIATLRSGVENTVILHPPGTGVVTILPDHAPPTKVYQVIPAPAGGSMIPAGPVTQLAEANGMNVYQMQGTAKDGTLVLPAFLSPGTYDLYLVRREGKPFVYQKVGTITTPLTRNVVVAFKSP